MKITSPAFTDGSVVPHKYTCDGQNVNPELTVDEIPPETKSLALIVDDPDSPSGNFVHWLVWNIPPSCTTIPEGTAESDWPAGVMQGTNDFLKVGYGGPCPGSGKHHYHFKIFALDTLLDLPAASNKDTLIKALNGQLLAQGDLVGLYQRLQS